MEPIINSPFKFLDPYGRDDYNIFFGRDEEINQLYQHIHKNRLVLVYGTSGTGKTSIVQCGLMNRMDDTDWTPFFIRRGDNINDSLLNNLKQAANTKTEVETGVTAALSGKNVLMQAPSPRTSPILKNSNTGDQVYDSLKSVNLRYLRSVYLIFDQFEELLIMGSEAEKKTFIGIIDHILTDPELQFCSLLFIMREEFFAGLSEFEKEIPDFCDRRLRIEPMNARNVEEVITRSCEKFSIGLQEGPENARQIISVLMEKGVVSLPYLQIYLDQLWRSVYMITPVKTTAPGKDYPALTFNNAIIKRFGGMQEVLERFIRERITVIQDLLEKEFPGIPEDFVSNVLDAFVTSEGTKRPLAYIRINNGIWFTGQAPPYLQKRPGGLMIRCLSEMEKNKILRTEGLTYELAHDVLAGLIDSRRTEDQRRSGFTDQQIRSRYSGYQNKISELLSNKEIESYRPYIEQLNLPPEIIAFYEASVQQRDRIAQQRAAEAQKLQQLKERQRRWKWGWVSGGFLLIAATGLYFYSQMLRREFNRNESLVFMGYNMKNLDPVEALNLFGPIKEKVYGEDTNKVNQKLLEFMQSQGIQSLFAKRNKYLPVSLIEQGRIDISEDGRFIVLDKTPEARSIVRDFMLFDNNGRPSDSAYQLTNITYAYFTNRPHILLLYIEPSEEMTERKKTLWNQINAPTRRLPPVEPPASLQASMFILFDCIKKTGDTIRFTSPQQHLHTADEVEDKPLLPEREFDSHRVRFTENGNLIVPYTDLDASGFLKDTLQLRDGQYNLIASLPTYTTVTTPRDYSQILTIEREEDGEEYLNIYNTGGQLSRRIRNILFGDFTEDGAVIWGGDKELNVLDGRDTLRFELSNNVNYAFGSLSRKKLLARLWGKTLELIDMNGPSSQLFDERLVASNFEKNVFITRSYEPEPGPEIGPLDTLTGIYFKNGFLPIREHTDTLRRRDLEGKLAAKPYTHPDGFKSVRYNRGKDEILLLTKQNKLILLDKDLREKTAMQLTANDRCGLSDSGEILYYVLDNCLSVFDNNLQLHVFDPQRAWAQLQLPLLKRDVTKQRRKELGLKFK
jgi:hypothetical protein